MSGDDYLNGEEGQDIIDGGVGNDSGAGNDTLAGSVGNDTLDGGTGNDIYLFSLGDGADTINNYDTAGIDTISFGAGIGPADLDLIKDGNNLLLRIGNGTVADDLLPGSFHPTVIIDKIGICTD